MIRHIPHWHNNIIQYPIPLFHIMQAEDVLRNSITDDSVAEILDIIRDLINATSLDNGNGYISLLPRDLNTTNFVLTNFIDMLESQQNITATVGEMEVSNLFPWKDCQASFMPTLYPDNSGRIVLECDYF